MRPLRLGDNRVPVYYTGGSGISAFRGIDDGGTGPEDWVGSLSALPAMILPPGAASDTGVSRTPDGRSLRHLVAADPTGWLGPRLASELHGQSGLLVKLLDAGERLPVHCHPSRAFAAQHLASAFGKTEGWIVMRTEPGARIWIGMRDSVDRDDLRRWIDTQDVRSMLTAMNELTVTAGQVVYVPAGVPHSIGPGVMLTELQEPTSFSVLADHDAFGVPASGATLGLGWELALSCFDLDGYLRRMDELLPTPTIIGRNGGSTVERVFPCRADEFFRAVRVSCAGSIELTDQSFSIAIVTSGRGELAWSGGRMPVGRGDTLVVPWSAGPLGFSGTLSALVCLPPAPPSP